MRGVSGLDHVNRDGAVHRSQISGIGQPQTMEIGSPLKFSNRGGISPKAIHENDESLDKKNALYEDLNISSAAKSSIRESLFQPFSSYDDRNKAQPESKQAEAMALKDQNRLEAELVEVEREAQRNARQQKREESHLAKKRAEDHLQEYTAKLLVKLEDQGHIKLPEISPKYRAASEMKRYDAKPTRATSTIRAATDMKNYEAVNSQPYQRGLNRVPSNKGYLLTPSQHS